MILAALGWLIAGSSAQPSSADGRNWLGAVGERLSGIVGGTAQPRPTGLARAIAHMAQMPDEAGVVVLAAHAGSEEHWTFTNRAGEKFTAGTPDELGRVLSVLAPSALQDGSLLAIVLSADTIFSSRAAMRHLPRLRSEGEPRGTPPRLIVALEAKAYRLIARTDDKDMRLLAEVRPRVLVEITGPRDFDETVWQLSHPLRHENIRIVALEPGGPAAFTVQARLDSRTKRALTDVIDPAHVTTAFSSIRRQTVILTGRIEGSGESRRLQFRASSGTDRSLALADVEAGASFNDINLLVLHAVSPRQPGARNWLWLPVAVSRLDEAVVQRNLADFLEALLSGDSRLLVSLEREGRQRIRLRAEPFKAEASAWSGIGETLGGIVSHAAGRIAVSGAAANLRSADRQVEIDARLIPGIPSLVQLSYLALLGLGGLGWRTAYRWWARIWPAEQRQGYSGLAGYIAARTTRLVAFLLIFTPIVAAASVPAALAGTVFRRRRPDVPTP